MQLISLVLDIFYNFIGKLSLSLWYHIWDPIISGKKAKTRMISYCFVISYMISYQNLWYHAWYHSFRVWQERLRLWNHIQFHYMCNITYNIIYDIIYDTKQLSWYHIWYRATLWYHIWYHTFCYYRIISLIYIMISYII